MEQLTIPFGPAYLLLWYFQEKRVESVVAGAVWLLRKIIKTICFCKMPVRLSGVFLFFYPLIIGGISTGSWVSRLFIDCSNFGIQFADSYSTGTNFNMISSGIVRITLADKHVFMLV